MDTTNDQLSIKTLLFTKAIPNYVIPIPTTGHRVYACTDCGDKFVLQSSYELHVNRKAVQITYFCRFCNTSRIFFNRCNMLSHIRSHAFKTATINVSDLEIEPLPLKYFNMNLLTSRTVISPQGTEKETGQTICFECKDVIKSSGFTSMQKARAGHFMEFVKLRSCPVCMFALPTICALKAHLRFHLKCPPYICPECGLHFGNRFPILNRHSCSGFKMIVTTTRIKCKVQDCHLLHPTEYAEHIKQNHLKVVYKCSLCYVACFEQHIMDKHLSSHDEGNSKILTFYQCQLCPGKLVLKKQIENHLKSHANSGTDNVMYPCWACGTIFKQALLLVEHFVDTHDIGNDVLGNVVRAIKQTSNDENKSKIYRVVKICEQCKRSFTYKCKFDQIKSLPIECPYKCTISTVASVNTRTGNNEMLTCRMCKNKISQNWDEIKKHFDEYHKAYRCIDIRVILPKIDIEKYINKNNKRKKLKRGIRKRVARKTKNKLMQNQETMGELNESKTTTEPAVITITKQFFCNKCGIACNSRHLWEDHLLKHRDPYMAYQCMECGQCFVVKPSFTKHLLLEHSIENVEDYINEKKCFNDKAFVKYQDNTTSEPLRENQCKICRDQFEDPNDLEKHFRVHGMAFLMKNNPNKNASP